MKASLRNRFRRRVPVPTAVVVLSPVSPPPPPPPPPPPAVPVNVIAPVVTGSLVLGSTLTCSTGTWTNSPTSYSYQWHEGGPTVGTNANTYVSTLAGATVYCVVTALNAVGSGVALSQDLGPITPADLTAPVLTLTSGSADPPVFTRAVPTGVGEGDFVQRRIDTATTYDTVNYRYEERVLGFDGTAFVLLDTSTQALSPFTIQTGLTPSTAYVISERFRRFEGDTNLYSDWSSNVSFTLSSLGVSETWSTTDHATWGGANAMALSAGNRTITAKASGDYSGARANVALPATGKVYFALTMDAKVGSGAFKLGFATNAWGAAGVLTGVGNSGSNLNQTIWIDDFGQLYEAGAYVTTPITALANGDRIHFAIDYSLGKYWVKKNTGSWNGDPVAGTTGRSLTANLIATAAKPMCAIKPQTDGQANVVSIDLLTTASSNKPSGYTAVGA